MSRGQHHSLTLGFVECVFVRCQIPSVDKGSGGQGSGLGLENGNQRGGAEAGSAEDMERAADAAPAGQSPAQLDIPPAGLVWSPLLCQLSEPWLLCLCSLVLVLIPLQGAKVGRILNTVGSALRGSRLCAI